MKRVELGCPGHLVVAGSCQWRRHTQVGNFRVSTLGNYHPRRGEQRETIGSGHEDFFETMVFATLAGDEPDNEGCGCRRLQTYDALDCERYATAGAAQAGHEAMVTKYARLARVSA